MKNNPESCHVQEVRSYYEQTEKAYNNWGKDIQREGIYALHCGYEIPGEKIDHLESVKRLTKEVIQFSQIQDNDKILDAGCGTGAVAFEIKSQYPGVQVHGINLAQNQLQTAISFVKNKRKLILSKN
jgi:cyclopropane fatty-acyl-phospholipid synthase-like methyltransferase